MRLRSEHPLIEFFSTVDGLNSIEEVRPQPSRNFIPYWWKELPKGGPGNPAQTARVCPSFPDFFSSGFVVPMWADTTLFHDVNAGLWSWKMGKPMPENPFSADSHPSAQFTDYVTPLTQGNPGSFVFKFHSPWKLKTPKGYSVLQLPMFYHFNNEFSVLPGVIHTDMHHVINQQVLYHGNGQEIFIKRGTPLVQYFPFKRADYGITTRDATEQDTSVLAEQDLNLISKFLGSGAYSSYVKRKKGN